MRGIELTTNSQASLKERLKKGEVVLGTWGTLPSASVMNVLGLSGLDFVIIDMEHGPIDIGQAEQMVQTLEVSGTVPIIRVSTNDPSLILRALDIGAQGVQIPHISTEEDARLAVRSAKYAPEGERGFTPFTRAGQYGLAAEGYAEKANEQTMVILNVEGVKGLHNLKEILKVNDIDVVFIGPYDLSQSLGKTGQVEDPKIVDYIRSSVQLMKSQGVACGSFAGNGEFLKILMDCGVQYITFSVDSAVMMKAYQDILSQFHMMKKGSRRGQSIPNRT